MEINSSVKLMEISITQNFFYNSRFADVTYTFNNNSNSLKNNQKPVSVLSNLFKDYERYIYN